MKRRVVCMLLSFALMLNLPLLDGFYAYSQKLSSGICGKNAKYEFDLGTLTITGSGDMEFNGKSPFESNSSIEYIIIENGITGICDGAFSNCANLSDVLIADSVLSIGENAFFNCKNLSSAEIPKNVNYIGRGAFSGCDGLKSFSYGGTKEQWQKIKMDSSILPDNVQIICNDGEITPSVPEPAEHIHIYYHYIIKQPDCTEDGTVVYVCVDGDDEFTSAIPHLGHDYKDGICIRCKAKDPKYKVNKVNQLQPKNALTSKDADFKISVKLKKLKKGKKSFTAIWKKTLGVDGYQIQYSLKKNMKNAKKKNINPSKSKLKVKKLKKGKKYYVRIRAYKYVGNKKIYSKWSAKKTVKVK